MILSCPNSVQSARIVVLSAGEDGTAWLLHDHLATAGYEVLRAVTSEEAIELSINERPAALFVEFPLPDCEGKAAESAACLSLCSVARVVIAIGAKPDPELAARVFEAGCADYVVKPLDAREVLARLENHLAIEADRHEQDDCIERLARSHGAGHHSAERAVHDLTNFLLSIRGLSQLLLEGAACQNDPNSREFAEAILSASAAGLSRLEAALEWTAKEENADDFIRGRHDVRELLVEAIGSLAGWALHKKIELKLLEGAVGLSVCCDRKTLIRAIENLLSNAVKYAPRGTVVEVEALVTDGRLEIAVRDEGPGFMVDDGGNGAEGPRRAAPTGGEPSTGLGLAICREIVGAHEGRVECRNLLPRGSEFVISLPIARDAA